MEKTYNPKEIESQLYAHWEQAGYFAPTGKGIPFSVVIPPPNVTGVLHMGHALNMTLQDVVVRYKRMQGFDVLWVPGTDHAGIATQNVVEKALKKEGKTRFDFGREAFEKRVWEWKQEYGCRITDQIRKLGASVDWKHERFTMDDRCAAAVKETFVSLYEQGLIYRGNYIINWCPQCRTALSDIEVNHDELKGHMWDICYPLVETPSQGVIVSTTRPETMFGDTAIVVHPDDERFKALVGKHVRIPLTDKTIPIIADTAVDLQFGTGAVKVTPAHDLNDFNMGIRHDLPQILVMDEGGIMNKNVPPQFQNLERYACRRKLVDALQQAGHLIQIRDHVHAVGHCYRCHTSVEPYLSTQWFVAMKQLADPAIEAVKNQQIQFVPERWEKLYFDWMEGIRDWCISRQIWWGHRIPVWYCNACPDKPIVSKITPDICPFCGGKDLKQDDDVLDTWFSSALWPFSTLGWPQNTPDLARYYPTTLLITGYDILTFWVSRMITMGYAKTGQKPFSHVYLHGLIRDAEGKKMSKSLGNVMDPLQLIDQYGADALRFSLASLATLGGQDIRYSEEKIAACRNFANKVWNVTRYVMMILGETSVSIDLNKATFPDDLAAKWIQHTFTQAIERITKALEQYNFSMASEILWDLVWNQFCDWYIEISKLNKQASLPLLTVLLVEILKLLHPFMPFLTEAIWQHLRQSGRIIGLAETIMHADFPKAEPRLRHETAALQMETVIDVTREIRNLRKQLNVPLNKLVSVVLVSSELNQRSALQAGEAYIKSLAKCEGIQIFEKLADPIGEASTSVVRNIEIIVPLKDLINVDQERTRLQKQLTQLEVEFADLNTKLNNQSFVTKAPAAVVDKIRARKQQVETDKQLVEKQIQKLQ